MPTAPQSASVPPAPQQVWVAIYEHPHGTDVHVFVHEPQATRLRTELAKECWSNAFEDDPPPDDEIGAEYFERMLKRDEFFSMMPRDIEVDPDASPEAPPADL